MDASAALADLTEISSQIEAAVLLAGDGSVLASTFDDAVRSERLAKAGTGLLQAAAERSGNTDRNLTQLEVALHEGSVFVARDPEATIVATTAAGPSSGLVFYDLKTCLRSLEVAPPKPKRRPRKKAAPDA